VSRILLALLVAFCLVMTGCAGAKAEGAAPRPTPSASASPTPSSPPSILMPTADPPTASTPEQTPETPPERQPEQVPEPVQTRGADEVDPATHTSHAIDTQNATTLPGVEFTTSDGRIICGILTWGHLSSQPGTASCTVDSHRDLFPQPFPETGPYVQSVMVEPVTGALGLYPDWFAQPERTIPVLAEGKSITFEGTICAATTGTITCTITSTGHGFVVSSTEYSLF